MTKEEIAGLTSALYHLASGASDYQEVAAEMGDILRARFRSVAASARREALEEARQVAIQKGIGNGHMETCAWIADRINLLKGSSAPASPTERR